MPIPGAGPMSGSMASECGPTSEFHQWPLPSYLWLALHRLYQSIYCSEPHLRTHQSLDHTTEAWVGRDRGRITAVILFQVRKHLVSIVNEMHVMPAKHLDNFMQDLLRRYPAVHAMQLHALQIDGRPQHFPMLRAEFSEDYLLRLPATVDAWRASLSSKTREKLRYYGKRMLRKQPGLTYRQIPADAITEAQFERVLQLSRARMHQKQRIFLLETDDAKRLYALMKECGQISVIEIGGEISAGMLCTRLGKSLFVHVLAHDPRHDDLRLGFFCCSMTIEATINQGMNYLHFLWGHYDYKVRLGAQREPLHRAIVFRSWVHAILHPGPCAGHLMALFRQQLRDWRRS